MFFALEFPGFISSKLKALAEEVKNQDKDGAFSQFRVQHHDDIHCTLGFFAKAPVELAKQVGFEIAEQVSAFEFKIKEPKWHVSGRKHAYFIQFAYSKELRELYHIIADVCEQYDLHPHQTPPHASILILPASKRGSYVNFDLNTIKITEFEKFEVDGFSLKGRKKDPRPGECVYENVETFDFL